MRNFAENSTKKSSNFCRKKKTAIIFENTMTFGKKKKNFDQKCKIFSKFFVISHNILQKNMQNFLNIFRKKAQHFTKKKKKILKNTLNFPKKCALL